MHSLEHDRPYGEGTTQREQLLGGELTALCTLNHPKFSPTTITWNRIPTTIRDTLMADVGEEIDRWTTYERKCHTIFYRHRRNKNIR